MAKTMMIRYRKQLKTPIRAVFFIAAALASLISFGSTHAQIESFNLVSTDQKKLRVQATEKQELTVLYFTGIECPLAKLYAPRVVALAEEYSESVRFFGISSNQQDSAEEFNEFIEAHTM